MTNNPSAEKLWCDALEILRPQISIQSFNTWLKTTIGVSLSDETLLVSVPNKFALNWIADKFHNLILNAVLTASDRALKVEYISRDEVAAPAPPAGPHVEVRPQNPRPSFDTQLNTRYIFDNFVVGDSNQFAHAAAVAVAKAPMQTKYNPLYIYGGVGLGKTHLAQAIGNYVREGYANLKILYVTSERFTTDFIDAIGHQKTADFARLYRGVDLLLLDDIQFLTGKEATQEQFFHTFNALHQAGKQIVLTSDRSPREIKGLEDRLLSRFQSGLVADIQPPDLETRIAILQQIVQSEKQAVSFDVLTYIARNITRNIRELEGSIVRLLAYGSITGRSVNVGFAQEILKDAFNTGCVITIESISKAVCDYFKILPEQLKSKRKTADIARARQIAMYLCRKHTSSSLKFIGEEFGGRDHSTVIHAISVVEDESKLDLSLKRALDDIENNLKG
jgi:chromosomal replication initiator protein